MVGTLIAGLMIVAGIMAVVVFCSVYFLHRLEMEPIKKEYKLIKKNY